jgi:DNA-binding winged helix-turn-helix (wHTH) protein/Flp pilus assembly protein TadD
MKSDPAPGTRVRFGTFEADFRSGELRCKGFKVKIQELPFQVLTVLLDRPGEVVTREDLRKRLWPADTFVDFDQGLNKAINKLREALGDDANNPRFVETLPRRGYRFIYPVTAVSLAATSPDGLGRGLKPTPAMSSQEESGAGKDSSDTQIIAALATRHKLGLGIALLALISLGLGYWLWQWYTTPALTEKDSILITDFVNTTGDPEFDVTLRLGLEVALRQSPYLNVTPRRQIMETLKLMGQPPDARVTQEIGREICQRNGIRAVLIGRIASLGSQYVITLEAVNASNGDILAETQTQAQSKEQVVTKLGYAATQLRSNLGESLASIKKFDKPLEQVTTASLAALKAYSLGWAKHMQPNGNESDAAPLFRRAVSLDPNFAMAYAALGTAEGNLGKPVLAQENFRKAYELRNRASERERFYITAHYYDAVTGEYSKMLETYHLWSQSYPRDLIPYGNAAGRYADIGDYQRALAEAQKVVALNPGDDNGTTFAAEAFLGLNRFDEASALLRKGLAQSPNRTRNHALSFSLAFAEGDNAAMAREKAWARGNAAGIFMLGTEANAQAFGGHLEKAQQILHHAAEQLQSQGLKRFAARQRVHAATIEAVFGESQSARKDAAAALDISRDRVDLSESAVALAWAGDLAGAQKLADEAVHMSPKHTFVNEIIVPAARAEIAIQSHNPAKAIQLLQVSAPYELGGDGVAFWTLYTRGHAYLAARDGANAEGQFQEILDHRGVHLTSPLYPLARLALARAFVLQGRKDKARKAYQDFLALWKDADPGIPVLKQARAEYARLQ